MSSLSKGLKTVLKLMDLMNNNELFFYCYFFFLVFDIEGWLLLTLGGV